jgi:hypothetical protein
MVKGAVSAGVAGLATAPFLALLTRWGILAATSAAAGVGVFFLLAAASFGLLTLLSRTEAWKGFSQWCSVHSGGKKTEDEEAAKEKEADKSSERAKDSGVEDMLARADKVDAAMHRDAERRRAAEILERGGGPEPLKPSSRA